MNELSLIEIKDEYVTQWEEWGNFVSEHKEKYSKIARSHGYAKEDLFLIKIDGKNYLGFYTVAGEMSNEPIFSKKHRELLKKSRVSRTDGSQLYSL